MSELEMVILGIESAIAGGSLVLFRGSTELGLWTGDASITRAEDLLPNISRLLDENSMRPADIDRIAVSVGPGSFTGIRIGLATVLGLRAALSVECVATTALEAMALAAGGKRLVAAVPTGGGNAAIQQFQNNSAMSAPKIIGEDEIASAIKNSSADVAVLHNRLIGKVERLLPARVIVVNAGQNLARLIAAASESAFARQVLEPMFLSRILNQRAN